MTEPRAPAVLLVDDEPRNLQAMETVLGDLELEIVSAASGEQALSLALSHDLALIIMDVRMPEMDGYETARLLRGHPSTEAVPIIFVTATARELGYEFQGYQAGAVDFLYKPINELILRSKVSVFLELDRRRRALERARRKLTESDIFLRSVLGAMSDGVVMADARGQVLLSNVACDLLLGVAVARTEPEAWGLLDPDRQAPARPEELPLARALEQRRPVAGDFLVRHERRPEGIWLSARANPVHAESGALLGVVCAFRDISAAKRTEEDLERRVAERGAELRESEARLRRSQKLEALGTLAGGVAHDFNNLLAAILGFSQFVREGLDSDDPLVADVREIERAAERGAALTRRLLLFSRKESGRPVVLDLNEIIGGIEQLLRRTIGEQIELHTSLAADLPHVVADPTHIEQILVNLGVNARDAMPDGGRLEIRSSARRVDGGAESKEPFGFSPAPGDHACLEVSDNGCGMDREVLERIFEPFFTTKVRERGTGLGLAIVYGIVQKAGGGIEVESEPGRGSRFRICLPATDEPLGATPVQDAPQQCRGRGETVLLAEDDDGLRELTARVLSTNGYQVLRAACGAEAQRLFDQFGGRVDLLLTDVVMPDLSGPTLARSLRERLPELPVVFVSGYSDETGRHHGLDPEGSVVVHKPFKPEELLRALRGVLEEAGGAG